MNTQQKLDHMASRPLGKRFVVPGFGDLGPAVIELSLPHVKVTDSAGRVIVITPRQAELVAAALDNVTSWFEDVEDLPEDVAEDVTSYVAEG
ncbi:hypothetical protein ABZ816_21760 [Actinosynnema sp. NPDC047251]|uniref:Uncharacterized protein n=1 Tax=Saccharothrix espanaensis (strain ATCC 51144 / DSM 44229 / JCM 9112 / NBRC 15066 / NRRL 15764) TaxID=1179773 RepID=K0K0J3_SACES|nr:hypothetical protein [Saccharothrix espanaensis]CCH33770.1 hypothetical protein BN6_65280 [Saccharothrix espanaensis DSM 44229]